MISIITSRLRRLAHGAS